MPTRIIPRRIMSDTRFDFPEEVIDFIRELHAEFVERRETLAERVLWQDMQERDLIAGGGWD